MTRRNRNGRFSNNLRPHEYAGFWLVQIALSIVGLTVGLQNAARFEVYAVASDLSGGQPVVQSEIVSISSALADDASTAGEAQTTPEPTATPEPTPNMDKLSGYISEAVAEFLPNHKSEALMIMHCLAHRENGHAGNLGARGDNGKAIGAFQFHQPTWERMRGQMIRAGVATEVSDPMNVKEATRTTAWAIANGRAREWGPIYRKSNGSDYAVCQVPSWYQ